jgi:hypothetical protein
MVRFFVSIKKRLIAQTFGRCVGCLRQQVVGRGPVGQITELGLVEVDDDISSGISAGAGLAQVLDGPSLRRLSARQAEGQRITTVPANAVPSLPGYLIDRLFTGTTTGAIMLIRTHV